MKAIPWGHIDALSYGPTDYYVQGFMSWLHQVAQSSVRVIILPSPQDVKDQFTVGMASSIIREYADRVGLIVMTEHKLKKRGLLRKPVKDEPVAQPFRFPNPFEQLVVSSEGVGEFVPFS